MQRQGKKKKNDSQALRVDLTKSLKENEEIAFQKFKTESQEILNKYVNTLSEMKLKIVNPNVNRLERIEVQSKIEEIEGIIDIEIKKRNPILFFQNIRQIEFFITKYEVLLNRIIDSETKSDHLSFEEQYNKMDSDDQYMFSLFRKANQHLKKKKQEELHQLTTSFTKPKRRKLQEDEINEASRSSKSLKSSTKFIISKNLLETGFQNQKLQNNIEEISPYLLALYLGELKINESSNYCPPCLYEDSSQMIKLEYVEKPEPRWVCIKCGYSQIIADVYFDNNREKETLDSTGWGSIGTKPTISELIRNFVEVDMDYYKNLSSEIQNEIYLSFDQHGKIDLDNLSWGFVESCLKELSISKGKKDIYPELVSKSYWIFCGIRGSQILTFTEDEASNVYDLCSKFSSCWNESEKIQKSASPIVIWLFIIKTLGYSDSILKAFQPSKTLDPSFYGDNIFEEICLNMGIAPPIYFHQLFPKFDKDQCKDNLKEFASMFDQNKNKESLYFFPIINNIQPQKSVPVKAALPAKKSLGFKIPELSILKNKPESTTTTVPESNPNDKTAKKVSGFITLKSNK
jgi:hypothetical protein